jgi:hypothetical protein
MTLLLFERVSCERASNPDSTGKTEQATLDGYPQVSNTILKHGIALHGNHSELSN